MKTRFTLLIFTTALAILASSTYSLHAQLIPVPLEKRMATAQLVIEGEVIHSHSFFGDNRNIYTSHIVRIDKIIKGSPAIATLEIILEGGTVGGKSLWISDHLVLGPKSSGVFFLNPLGDTHPAKLGNPRLAFDVYADSQGFIAYMEQPGATIAVEPFHVYRSIATDLYPLLGLSGVQAPVKHKPIPLRVSGGPIIDSIRPLEVTAGTRTTLSIYGHGFLSGQGTVQFPNANTGGTSMMVGDSTDVQQWTDTLIRVWVPSIGALPFFIGTAGSGQIEIENISGDTARSAENLAVLFGIKNVRNQNNQYPIGVAEFASLFDQDSHVPSDTSGGYTFRLSDSFSATDSAEVALKQALRQWRCATGVNFKIGADTSLNVSGNDLVNLVRWDDFPDTLATGRLARTTLYFVDCVVGQAPAYQISEIDFTVNREFAWNFGTTGNVPSKVDFYSVALHEMGHAHGLEHVIDTNEVMYYKIAPGERKAMLTVEALDAGFWMMDSSVVARGNCYGPMTIVPANDCNMLPVAPRLEDAAQLLLYPNPSNGTIHVKRSGGTQSRSLEMRLFDAGGNVIASNRFSVTSTTADTWLLDMNQLPSGLYLASLRLGNSLSNSKIVLSR